MGRKEGMGKVKRKRMNSVMAFGFLHCICIIISMHSSNILIIIQIHATYLSEREERESMGWVQ